MRRLQEIFGDSSRASIGLHLRIYSSVHRIVHPSPRCHFGKILVSTMLHRYPKNYQAYKMNCSNIKEKISILKLLRWLFGGNSGLKISTGRNCLTYRHLIGLNSNNVFSFSISQHNEKLWEVFEQFINIFRVLTTFKVMTFTSYMRTCDFSDYFCTKNTA